jgi:hypothetical protein
MDENVVSPHGGGRMSVFQQKLVMWSRPDNKYSTAVEEGA